MPYHRILSRLVESTPCLSIRLVIVFRVFRVSCHPASRISEETRGKRRLDGLIEMRSRSFPIFDDDRVSRNRFASFFEFSRRVVSSNPASCKMVSHAINRKCWMKIFLVSIANSFMPIVLDRDHLCVLFASVNEMGLIFNIWKCIRLERQRQKERGRETAIATYLHL